MRDELEPVAGNWYTHRDKGHTFQVVAVDQDRDMIEIQYFDGDLEEIDSDEWYDMDLEMAEPPEEERGPLDDDETSDDSRDSETAVSDRDYRDELAGNRPKAEDREDEEEEEEEEEDDWGERGSSDEPYEE